MCSYVSHAIEIKTVYLNLNFKHIIRLKIHIKRRVKYGKYVIIEADKINNDSKINKI